MTNRVGVFICHCGKNIARTVDIEALRREAAGLPGVEWAEDNMYLCSDPGQQLIRERIAEQHLDAVVVAACSPTLHTTTFRRAVESAGVNPFRLEIANIREQCSWVHPGTAATTRKAAALLRSGVEKARRTQPLEPIHVGLQRTAVVIGGGVAGIQAALDIAEAGYPVHLVEKGPNLGGHMAQLGETFPTLDCSSCILTPRMVEVSHHPLVTIHTLAEVTEVEGSIGNFRVRIRRQPSYVIAADCTGCGDCVPACPQVVPGDFDRGLGARKAIYIPFPQAVPFTYTLDREHCLNQGPLIICDRCAQACEPRAIDFDQQPSEEVVEAGAIVLATGYDTLPLSDFREYGHDRHPDVIDGLMFERLLSASGPTHGEIRRPSDRKVPKSIAFIQCAGSRDPERHKAYCSQICCMYTAKHALLYHHAVPDGLVYIFYIDIRAGGKGYEEFVERVRAEEGINYIRGKVAKLVPKDGQLQVWGVDTLIGEQLKVDVDLVVLATAVVPSQGIQGLARVARVAIDGDGFLSEAHPKLRPVESQTRGIYLAGMAQGPRDISATVAHAAGAASKVLGLFSHAELVEEPTIAQVNEALCRCCGFCVSVCPYEAISLRDDGKASVNETLCRGCGACTPACFAAALGPRGFEDDQILAQIGALAW
ncbi:MAG: CoB--CoM heterodisulfide reductase iron-sulfur subunit A family protein [Chromatiales bacterium]|jgi:heterodisulfide reductase subunit A